MEKGQTTIWSAKRTKTNPIWLRNSQPLLMKRLMTMLNKNIWTQILCLIGCFMADCTVWSGYLKFFFHISVKHRVTCKTSLHKIMELRHVYSPIYHHPINAWKTLVGIHHYTCGNNKTCGKMLSRLWPIITTFQNMDIGTCNKIDCLP